MSPSFKIYFNRYKYNIGYRVINQGRGGFMFIIMIIMAFVMYIVFENNKMQILFDYLRHVDLELENKLIPYISIDGDLDIFTIQEIRNMMKKEFILKHKIDEFKVYKDSMYKVIVVIRRGLAIQGLELITNDSRLKLKETFMTYSKVNFSKE